MESGELTERQQELARCLARGLTDTEIAQELGVLPPAVRIWVHALRDKVGAQDQASLRAWVEARIPPTASAAAHIPPSSSAPASGGETEDRTPYEELGLSTKAWNYLKVTGVQYIDEVQAVLEMLNPDWLLAVELRERLRNWDGLSEAVAKIEVAIKALEDLVREPSEKYGVLLEGDERRAVAEAAETLRVQVVRLRDRQGKG
jgi:DNA-binding CsgD family transcriptional regulator